MPASSDRSTTPASAAGSDEGVVASEAMLHPYSAMGSVWNWPRKITVSVVMA